MPLVGSISESKDSKRSSMRETPSVTAVATWRYVVVEGIVILRVAQHKVKSAHSWPPAQDPLFQR